MNEYNSHSDKLMYCSYDKNNNQEPARLSATGSFIGVCCIPYLDSSHHGIAFMWKHIVGLLALPLIVLVFFRNHKAGVLVLGLTLCLGLFSLLSYNPVVTTFTLTVGGNVPVFYGQPVFLLWLLLHFVVSGRYYVGILTRKYWEELFPTVR